jgi:hypothetical protein
MASDVEIEDAAFGSRTRKLFIGRLSSLLSASE